MNTSASSSESRKLGSTKATPKQLTIALSVLLLLQIAGAVILFSEKNEFVGSDPSANLLTADPEHLEKITLEEGKEKNGKTSAQQPLVMKKLKGGWVLSEDHDFPVDNKSIQLFTTWFKTWKKSVPVSTSADAVQRFKVGGDNYEELITVTDDHHRVNKVYLGAHPRFKSQYARLADSNDVYTVDLPDIMHMPNSSDEVIDRAFLQPNLAILSSLTIGDATISRPASTAIWNMTSGGIEHGLGGAAAKLVFKPLKFYFNTLLGTKPDPSYNQDNPELVLKISTSNGANAQEVTYTFSKPKDKPYYVLKPSDKDCFVSVDETVIKAIKKIPADFVAAEAAQKTAMEKQKSEAEKSQKDKQDKKK